MVERWDQGTCTTTCGPGTREVLKETIVVPSYYGVVCQQKSRKETFVEDCGNAVCPPTSFMGDKDDSKGVLLVENGDTKIYLEPLEEKDLTGER